ncbi:MAG: hypothetical protein WCN87_03670, partial [Chlamydiota bacterium]
MDSISTSLPTEYTPPTSSDSNDSSASTGKPSSQAQGKGTPAVSTAGGTSAYASLQGTQGKEGPNAQNINATLGQALGATQDSIADSSLSQIDDDAQDGTTGNFLTGDIGLNADHQVAPGGARGHKGSHAGSGGESEKGEVYTRSSAAGLQKGQTSIQSASSAASSKDVSTFTLKVDPTTTSSTSDTSSTSSTSSTYVDSNEAPAIPTAPNVFAMIEDSTSLSSQLQEYQVSQMVSSSSAQNTILSQEYSNQITNIQNYISAKNSSTQKSGTAKAFNWIVDIAMIVVGAITADPMLVAAGIMGCVMTADPKITAGLTSALEKIGLPPAVASIMATLIIVAAASVGGMGV